MNEFDNLIENYQVNCAQIPDLIVSNNQVNCNKLILSLLEKPTKLIVSSNHVYSIILARFNCAHITDLIHHSYQLKSNKPS
jgi:hypothetical protein